MGSREDGAVVSSGRARGAELTTSGMDGMSAVERLWVEISEGELPCTTEVTKGPDTILSAARSDLSGG